MKSRINISMAGTMAANINHSGRACDIPSGLISQPLSSGAVGDTPSGTSSF